MGMNLGIWKTKPEEKKQPLRKQKLSLSLSKSQMYFCSLVYYRLWFTAPLLVVWHFHNFLMSLMCEKYFFEWLLYISKAEMQPDRTGGGITWLNFFLETLFTKIYIKYKLIPCFFFFPSFFFSLLCNWYSIVFYSYKQAAMLLEATAFCFLMTISSILQRRFKEGSDYRDRFSIL